MQQRKIINEAWLIVLIEVKLVKITVNEPEMHKQAGKVASLFICCIQFYQGLAR